ncbi:hypothetical protein L6164_037886 [Bauhinia variegata]|uniref:Uncharacterized protein n=3 Tax=Bauhinia variegata TaxID=167791 RepID=A0ACB9KL75_BAUVA|nr:hypothetical protein L6164_037785 [Bauhinia variegata]KAI4297978.1 hypothetical protein L6164_037832 [Bauhinia variegata]KAI4298034.1 hypothetical protein L6164_037886 [Bauhinia variegata]
MLLLLRSLVFKRNKKTERQGLFSSTRQSIILNKARKGSFSPDRTESAMVAKFLLNEKWHNVEYEGLHTVCFSCGMYGHNSDRCLKRIAEMEAELLTAGAIETERKN